MNYTAHLVKFGKTKKINFYAKDSISAGEYISKTYPNWDISMFWYDWPQKACYF